MHRIQEEVLINSFYTLNSIFLFFPQFLFLSMGQPPPQMGNTLQLLHSSVYTFFSRVISVVFICLCFKVSNSLQIYEEQRQYANFLHKNNVP